MTDYRQLAKDALEPTGGITTGPTYTELAEALLKATDEVYETGYREGGSSAWADILTILDEYDDPLAELRQRLSL